MTRANLFSQIAFEQCLQPIGQSIKVICHKAKWWSIRDRQHCNARLSYRHDMGKSPYKWPVLYSMSYCIHYLHHNLQDNRPYPNHSYFHILEQDLHRWTVFNQQAICNEPKNDPTYGQFSSTLAKVLTSSILKAQTGIKRRNYFNIIFNVRIELCCLKENVGKTIWFLLNTVFRILYLQYNFASIDVMSWSTHGGVV